jgi:hypothetical protein
MIMKECAIDDITADALRTSGLEKDIAENRIINN